MARTARIAHVFLAALFTCGLAAAADWLTDVANPQRANWQQTETTLNPTSVKNIRLLWKTKLDNELRLLHSLFPPLIIEKLKPSAGMRQVGIEAGVSDNIYAIDVTDGKLLWKKHFTSTWTPPATAAVAAAFSAPAESRQLPSSRPRALQANTRFTSLRGTECCTS